MVAINVDRRLHVLEHLSVAEDHGDLAILLLFPPLLLLFLLGHELVELQLPLRHDIRVLLLDHRLDHEVDLQVGKARLEDLRLAKRALSPLRQGTFEAHFAEGVPAWCRHRLVHQLPADGAHELLRDLRLVLEVVPDSCFYHFKSLIH